MPTKAAKACKNRSCSGLVRDDVCSKCGPIRRNRGGSWASDKERGTAHQRGYGKNWSKLRKMILADMPLCNECMKLGFVVAATTVDHIIPKSQGGDDSLENLQSLCDTCHKRKSGREGARARHRKSE